MKEINGEVVHSIEFNYTTMYSRFYFTYANGLEGCIELMLEGNNDWILILKDEHEPEDIEVLLNELTDKNVINAFPGWKYCDLSYQHVSDIGWVIKSEFNPVNVTIAVINALEGKQ